MRVVFDTNVLVSALLFEQSIPARAVCRDPKDNMVLALAVSGKADVIVTGDADLLVLNSFRGIAILKPEPFLRDYFSN